MRHEVPVAGGAGRRRIAIPLLLLFLGCRQGVEEASPRAAAGSADGGWLALFNGRDLDGWTPKLAGHPLGEDPFRTFRVEDGLLTVSYENYDELGGRFGHLFHRWQGARYRLRAEYRFVGEQVKGGPGWAFKNSGLMLHGQEPQTLARDESFPVSIEVQLLGGGGEGERPTANLCTPGTHVEMDGTLVTAHCVNSSSPTFHGDEWVTVEVEVLGSDSITHFVNGAQVMRYEHPQLDPGDAQAAKLIRDGRLLLDRGSISIQAESHPIQFRKIELLPLDG